MDFFQVMAQRESCRAYQQTPVEKEKLVTMLEAARMAPSASNGQPWRFTCVTDENKVRALAKATQSMGLNGFTDQCPVLIVVQEVPSNVAARFGARVKHQDFSSLDIGIAVQQMCLAATAQGLSTCMIGWFDEEKVNSILGFDGKERVRLLVAVGYAVEKPIKPKKRKDAAETVVFVES